MNEIRLMNNPRVKQRRGRESNPRIEVLQTPTLPLGYPAVDGEPETRSAESLCQRAGSLRQFGVGRWALGVGRLPLSAWPLAHPDSSPPLCNVSPAALIPP